MTTTTPKFRINYRKDRGHAKDITTFENCFIVGSYRSKDGGLEGMKIWCPDRQDYRNLNHQGLVSVEVTGR